MDLYATDFFIIGTKAPVHKPHMTKVHGQKKPTCMGTDKGQEPTLLTSVNTLLSYRAVI